MFTRRPPLLPGNPASDRGEGLVPAAGVGQRVDPLLVPAVHRKARTFHTSPSPPPATAPNSSETALASGARKVRQLVATHLDTLARRRMALVSVGPYGVVNAKGWNAEVQHFLDHVVLPTLDVGERAALVTAGLDDVAGELMETPVRLEVQRLEGLLRRTQDVESLGPRDYERYCASLLQASGWECELTPVTGDQGADVLAKKDGYFVVVQCKKYAGTVGNGAVQEVIAARAHLRGTHAAVVTNSEYTRSARELAGSTGVLLLHHTDLDILDKKLA
jgi:restriction system protein